MCWPAGHRSELLRSYRSVRGGKLRRVEQVLALGAELRYDWRSLMDDGNFFTSTTSMLRTKSVGYRESAARCCRT